MMNDSSIIDLAGRAHACLSNGQLDEARSLYSRLCQLDSSNEEYWLTLAALNGETGKIDEALECANKAIELDGTYVEAYLTKANLQQRAGQNIEAYESALKAVERDDMYDEALLFLTAVAGHLNRFDEAEHWGQKTIALMPASVDALLNLGNAKYALEKYNEAESIYRKVIALTTSNQQAIVGLAKSVSAQERNEEAISILEPLVAIVPDNHHAKSTLAASLISLKRDEEAYELLVQLIKTNPDYVLSYLHISGILERRGDYLKAISFLEQALGITDEPLEILGELAHLYHEYGMQQQAIDACEKALLLEPDNQDARFFSALVLCSSARYEEALDILDNLGANSPDDEKILALKASAYERIGKLKEAHDIIKLLLARTPVPSSVISLYALHCHHFDECDQAVTLLNDALADNGLDNISRRKYLFTLGKLHDRLHNYDAAMNAIIKANDLKPCIYDHTMYTEQIDQLISPEITSLLKKPREINTSHRIRPVFIVGMPRSGTSLVEQILSSHPLVAAGGERHEIPSLVSKLPQMLGGGATYPECLKQLTADHINKILATYDAFTQNLHPHATVLTDKMPENFLYIVFIKMLFPDARIIHCVRDPMDTCLSCYFQEFTGQQYYAYKLENLGQHYSEYKRLMNHYRDVDKIPLFEVNYEDLVKNTEEVSRKMIDYCNLEWDEQCLRYYESERIVRTASFDQANKPVYTSSINKWKRYESHLKPLRDALNLH